MPKITFIAHNGQERAVTAEVGKSIMQAATQNLVPGLLADCGGSCSCATCHAYVDEPWSDQLPPASDDEKAMIECALHVQPASRLTCQIVMTAALDGIVVRTPLSQT